MWDIYSFLFYTLPVLSIIVFVNSCKRSSWKGMLVSGALLFPDAWYFSGYPPYPWVIFIPLIQVGFAAVFYLTNKRPSPND